MRITIGAVEALKTRIELAKTVESKLKWKVYSRLLLIAIAVPLLLYLVAGLIFGTLAITVVWASPNSSNHIELLVTLISAIAPRIIFFLLGFVFVFHLVRGSKTQRQELQKATGAVHALQAQFDELLLETAEHIDTADIVPQPVPEPRPASLGNDAPSKACPMCAEEVKAAARVCRYCRYEFGEAEVH